MVDSAADALGVRLGPHDRDEYAALADIDVSLMTWSMAAESNTGHHHSWAYDHIDDPRLRSCVPGDGMSLRAMGRRFIVKNAELPTKTVSMRSLLMFSDMLDGNLFHVLSSMGWDGLMRFKMLADEFPYREYLTTRKTFRSIISCNMDDPGRLAWLEDMIPWLMQDRPIITGGLTAGWVEENIIYPFGFLRESCDRRSGDIMESYLSSLDALLETIPRGGLRDSMDKAMRPIAGTSGFTSNVGTYNIDRWIRVVGRLRAILEDGRSRSMLDSIASVPAEINGFNVYPAIRRGSDGMVRNMRQSHNTTLEYAEHASAGRDGFERWVRWVRLQGELHEERAIAAYADEHRMLGGMLSTPTITSLPNGLAAWIDSGKVPQSLKLNGFMSLTIPRGSGGRLMIPLDVSRR